MMFHVHDDSVNFIQFDQSGCQIDAKVAILGGIVSHEFGVAGAVSNAPCSTM